MARRRMIDPNFWGSEDVSRLPIFSRLLLIGMISNADDEGRGRANPAYLRAIVFPYDDIPTREISSALADITKWIHVKVYTVDGQTYYSLTKWKDWQRVDSPKSSIIPAPPDDDNNGGKGKNSTFDSEIESGNESDIESNNGSKIESENESEIDSEIESNNESGDQSEHESEIESGNQTENQSKNRSEINSGLKEVKRSKDNIINYFCTEQSAVADSPRRSREIFGGRDPPDHTTPIITLTLNDKTEYPICAAQLREWAELYPAVDILQELRNMKGWLNANPRRRKTISGILRFVCGWLANEQNRGGEYRRQGRSPPDTLPRSRGNFKQREYNEEYLASLETDMFGEAVHSDTS